MNTTNTDTTHLRGDIFIVDFSMAQEEQHSTKDSIQYGKRPAIILQNDKANKTSQTTIVVPLTSAPKQFDIHPVISSFNNSYALPEQIRVVDNSRLISKVGEASESEIKLIMDVLNEITEFASNNEIVYVKLKGVGCEFTKEAPVPCLVIQSKKGFRYSTTLLVAPLTSHTKGIVTQVKLPKEETHSRFKYDSYVLFEQMIVISKLKIKSKQFFSSFSEKTISNCKKAFLHSIS